MIEINRTDSQNLDFIDLVASLDKYLKTTDGDEHLFYNQYNVIDSLSQVVIAYENGKPIGCGAFKEYEHGISEIKRMFVKPNTRSKGVGSKILRELEDWSRELLYDKCILETGIKQTEAIYLYKKNKYCLISNYGQYKDAGNSLCFEKQLIKKTSYNN